MKIKGLNIRGSIKDKSCSKKEDSTLMKSGTREGRTDRAVDRTALSVQSNQNPMRTKIASC